MIIPNGVVLEKHENATVVFLSDLGYEIELIPPVNSYMVKSADFIMLGLEWEMKSPIGGSRSTMEHVFQKASKQAENIVIDLRRTKVDDVVAVSILERRFRNSKRVKKMIVITKQQKKLEYSR